MGTLYNVTSALAPRGVTGMSCKVPRVRSSKCRPQKANESFLVMNPPRQNADECSHATTKPQRPADAAPSAAVARGPHSHSVCRDVSGIDGCSGRVSCTPREVDLYTQ